MNDFLSYQFNEYCFLRMHHTLEFIIFVTSHFGIYLEVFHTYILLIVE